MRKTKITGRKRRAAGLAAALFLTALLASGCQGGKEKYAFRETGISQMDAGDYEGALAYLEQGLAAGDAQARAELLYSQAVVYEHMLDFSSALRALETYEAEFGATPEIRKEIAFLKTR